MNYFENNHCEVCGVPIREEYTFCREHRFDKCRCGTLKYRDEEFCPKCRIDNEKQKIMDFARLNHRAEVAKLARVVTNRSTYGKPMYAIDANSWGLNEPFSDPENHTLYRGTLFELANDTFIREVEEMDYRHYPGAPYESIFDY